MIKRLGLKPMLLFGALVLGLAAAGCSTRTTGEVKEDVSITEQTKMLEEVGALYRGPEYTIAILKFENKTPSKVLGVGEAATDILRTIVAKAGLQPIVVSESELKDQEELIKLQQTGAVRKGKKDAAAGFESLDFRISGSVTSYAELEESRDVLITQSKTRIARVNVDYALVDIETGMTLVSDSGLGEYRKKTGGVLGFGSKSSADPGLRDGALRDALSKAMTSMIEKLNEIPFRSRVLLVDGPTVVIRGGTKSRLEPGAVLGVYRAGEELTDPDTGRVIGIREKLIGKVVVATHQSENITDTTVQSGGGFSRGDVVKEIK